MLPQDLKKALLQNQKSCRDAVCNAAANVTDKTRAFFRAWKYALQVACVAVAVAAVLGAGLAQEALADVTYQYTNQIIRDSSASYPFCSDSKDEVSEITATITFVDWVSGFTGYVAWYNIVSSSITANGVTFYYPNVPGALYSYPSSSIGFIFTNGEITSWWYGLTGGSSTVAANLIIDFDPPYFYRDSVNVRVPYSGSWCTVQAGSSLQPGIWTGGPGPQPTISPKNNGDCQDCDRNKPSTGEGNPINAGTGNKFQAETDFTGAPNTQTELRRYYNSQETTATPFGANWRSTWHRSLSVSADGNTVTITRADGRVDEFRKNTSGASLSTPKVNGQFTTTPSNGSQQTVW